MRTPFRTLCTCAVPFTSLVGLTAPLPLGRSFYFEHLYLRESWRIVAARENFYTTREKKVERAKEDANRLKYRSFAFNRLRTEAEIDQDFERLLAEPNLVELAFYEDDPDILMLLTPEIVIDDDGIKYNLGPFVIYLIRYRSERSWKVDCRFRAVSNRIVINSAGNKLIHPHINLTSHDRFETIIGRLCLVEGGEHIDTPLRQGRIPKAYQALLQVLSHYDEWGAFDQISKWPRYYTCTIKETEHAR